MVWLSSIAGMPFFKPNEQNNENSHSSQLPGLGSDIEACALGEAGPSGMGEEESLSPVAPSQSLEKREDTSLSTWPNPAYPAP